jgi:2-polyprenyl-3-methyl-5-hydroxy-6-metoxy-1,4-benzoquinol methylase
MSKQEVYFNNHDKALHFPWSIYHKPLIKSLEAFLRAKGENEFNVLVIGPGEFQEFATLKSLNLKISILDIDQRVIDRLQLRHGKDLSNAYLVDDNLVGYPSEKSFDLVYAKEVIEHLETTDAFLKKIHGVLKNKGKVWLSTPNYGFFLLPFLELTILELIARFSGFSRSKIHPSRFTKFKLDQALNKNGFNNLKVNETFLKLALTIEGEKKE